MTTKPPFLCFCSALPQFCSNSEEICTFADVKICLIFKSTVMAKGSPLMGTQRGRLGESVLYRSQGYQVSRAYIPHPNDRNSERQRVQRMIVATANAAYSSMKAICNHSFDNVPVGLKSMAHFLSLNATLLRQSISADREGVIDEATCEFNKRGNNNLILNPYIVSRGSLPEIQYVDFANSEEMGRVQGFLDIVLAKGITNADKAQYPAYWLRDNSVQDGDYITVCFILRHNGDIINGQQYYSFHWLRYLCVDTEGDLGHANKMQFSGADFAAKNVGKNYLLPSWVEASQIARGNAWTIDLGNVWQFDVEDVVAYTVIHSRWRGSRPWLRSNARMHVRTGVPGIDLAWPNDIWTSLETYDKGVDPIGAAELVLNGGAE